MRKSLIFSAVALLFTLPVSANADFFWQPTDDPEAIELWRSASGNVLAGISFGYSVLSSIESRNELGESIVAAIQRFESASQQYDQLLNSPISDLEIDIDRLLEANARDGAFAIQTFEQNGIELPKTVGDVLVTAISETKQAAEFLFGIGEKITLTENDRLIFDELMQLNSRLLRIGQASGLFLRTVSN